MAPEFGSVGGKKLCEEEAAAMVQLRSSTGARSAPYKEDDSLLDSSSEFVSLNRRGTRRSEPTGGEEGRRTKVRAIRQHLHHHTYTVRSVTWAIQPSG